MPDQIKYRLKKKVHKVEVIDLSVTKRRVRGRYVYLRGIAKTRSLSRPKLKVREYPWKVRGKIVLGRVLDTWRLRRLDDSEFVRTSLQLALARHVCRQAKKYITDWVFVRTATF